MTIKTIIVQQGQTLSQIAKANNTSVGELCKLNNIKDPDVIFTGQKIVTGADAPKEQPQEKQLNIGGAVNNTKNSDSIFTGQKMTANAENKGQDTFQRGAGVNLGISSALEYLPISDLDKARIADKAYNITSTYENAEEVRNARKTVAENNKLIKADKNMKAAKAKSVLHANKLMKAENNLNAARKELTSAIEANTIYKSEDGKHIRFRAKGPTAKRQFKAVKNFDKAQESYELAKKYKVTDKEVNKAIKAIKRTRVLSEASKGFGRALVPVAVAAEGFNVYTEYKKGGRKAAAKQAVRSTGAFAGAWAGAKGGAAVGAAIGSIVPGVGTAVGGVVGGIIGGVGGYIAGEKIMKKIVK